MERGQILFEIDSVVGGRPVGFYLHKQRLPRSWRTAKGQDAAVGFAGIGKQLALPEVNIEKPLVTADFREADRFAFTVVENMCGFMYHEIIKTIFGSKICRRNVACRVFAQPDDLGRCL